jgi:putative flippase GtrA
MPLALTQRLLARWNSDPLRRELFFFCLVGGLGFLVDFGSFVAFQKILSDVRARCLALACSTTLVWWLNRRHTFLSSDPAILREFGRFTLTRVLGIGINAVVSLFILWEFPQAGRLAAIACGTIVAMVINYLTSKYWAYKYNK